MMAPPSDSDAVTKVVRGRKKASVTKLISGLNRHILDDDKEKVKEQLGKLKVAFDDFDIVCQRYEETLTDDSDRDENDAYFIEAQDNYVTVVNKASDWLRSRHVPVGTTAAEQKSNNMCQRDIVGLLNLPKIELEPFDGNPLNYHSFMAVFDEVVHNVACDAKVKLTRLLQFTKDKAKEAIKSCILLKGDEGYLQAREILHDRFGNDHLVTERIVHDLRQGKQVKSPDDLRRLADELNNCQKTLSQMGHLSEVDNQPVILVIVSRLQTYLQIRWKRHAMEIKRAKQCYPGFEELVKFVGREADEATDPVYGRIGGKSSDAAKYKSSQSSTVKTSTSFTSNTSQPATKWKRPPCVLCAEDHNLLYCDVFKSKNPVDRLKLVTDNGLCETCLMSNHKTSECRKQYTCTVPGCGKRHSKFIHISQQSSDSSSSSNSVSNNVSKVASAATTVCSDVFLPIVSAVVNNEVDACILLDTASSSSFCSSRLVHSLGIKGRDVKYMLSTLNGTEEKISTVVDFDIRSYDGSSSLRMSNVLVVDMIPLPSCDMNVRMYPHLADLSIVPSCQHADILIGQDFAEALIPLEVRQGGKGEPFAVRTMFGWSINGPAHHKSSTGKRAISHFVSTMSIDDRVNKMWNIENERFASNTAMSADDKRVLELWDSKVQKVDGHYQLPIPWKSDIQVPNNIVMAKSRIASLKSSLKRKGLTAKYDDEIQKLMIKGYAESVPDDNICATKVWYLPHHAVVTDKKPGKTRIVYDCAAKYEGESLNDKCLQGPDLNNKLLHVLLRFRQYQYAIMSDVEAMYYQVLIPPDDRDALRFLWFDTDGNVRHYRMTRHVFGGIWCAASSTYALRRVLHDADDPDPIVSDTILRSFYVDDCLRSTASKDEAIAIIKGATSLLSTAGFKLTKFVANDADILNAVPIEDRAKEVKDFNSEVNSKALGVKWCVGGDYFYFDVNVPDTHKATRREILSVVSSTYDPLGLVSPVVLVGRLIFQEATRLQLSWDEIVPAEIQRVWYAWLQDLVKLKVFKIPRCVMPYDESDVVLELHNFSDASSKAYGCCTYLRSIDKHGNIHTVLLVAKARVAPLKSATIPRLELQAAVMSAEIDAMLRRELDFNLANSYFWVDSEIVLKYIKNESRRFHVYVSNRVSTIHELTTPSQWLHIPGKQNPADVVSRGEKAEYLDVDAWIHGPEFLRSYKNKWNVHTLDISLPESDPEVKAVKGKVCHLATAAMDVHPLQQMSEYYSSWYRLRRAVAWLLRLKSKIVYHSPIPGHKLTVNEIDRAEICIIRFVQQKSYSKEIKDLSRGDNVISLKEFDPILDEEGVIRVGGRLEYSDIPESKKHPYLISGDHPIARLIVQEEHDVAHLGREWVISEVRKRFWITKIRKLTKSIAHKCVRCKRLFGATSQQKMANHIPERLDAGNPPFTHVGVDCFGPFLVKQGRSYVKRYGCIFTCINIRAVHIEMLCSMDADSFINALRRFVSRRGKPSKIWSDNGTNFVGGELELNRSWNEAIEDYAVKMRIDWHFNPPGASHMGGLWERMIRTVRKVLAGISSIGTRLTDEILQTLLCEVESIINGRPITKASDDVNDLKALSPNHLLLGRGQMCLSPGKFDQVDLYKRRWRCVQHLTDEFWRRWIKEYLPEIQKRHKWTRQERNFKTGDLVLIADENTPRGVWPLGIVCEVNQSSDGLVRSVKVRTRTTALVRPVTKVVLLEGVE